MSTKKKLFYLSIIAIIIHTVTMFVLQEVLLQTITDSDIKYWARISSVISILLASALIGFILLIMFYAPYWLIRYLVDDKDIHINDYYKLFKSVVYSYIIFESFRLIFIMVFIDSEVNENIGNINFINNFDKSLIGVKLFIFDVSYILIVATTYIVSSYKFLSCGIGNSLVVGLAVLSFFVLINIETIQKILMYID